MKAALPQSKRTILTLTKYRILVISRWMSQLDVVFKQHLPLVLHKNLVFKGFYEVVNTWKHLRVDCKQYISQESG